MKLALLAAILTTTLTGPLIDGWKPVQPLTIQQKIDIYFQPAERDWAYRISWCESRWKPNAKNRHSTAAGIFQFLKGTWDWVAPKLGLPDYESSAPYNPSYNIRAAAWLYRHGGPSHWECK